MKDLLTIVVPCFNEEEVLPETRKELTRILTEIKRQGLVNEQSKILFVDDGSKDKTWTLIEKYTKEFNDITGN